MYNFRNFHRNISWTVDINMSELMMSKVASHFPYVLFTEMTKIPYFSYEKVKLALYPRWMQNNVCSGIYTVGQGIVDYYSYEPF